MPCSTGFLPLTAGIDPIGSLGIKVNFHKHILEHKNDDDTDSKLPECMTLDVKTGEIAGRVPYQPTVTKEYKFTVTALRYDLQSELVAVPINPYEDQLRGSGDLKIAKLPLGTADGIKDLESLKTQTIMINGNEFVVQGVNGENEKYDTLSLDKSLIGEELHVYTGIVYEPATYLTNPTYPLLKEGLETIKSWGFEYKTCGFSWIKQNKKADSLFWGLGYWTRANNEIFVYNRVDKNKYIGRTLKFSDSEKYEIESIETVLAEGKPADQNIANATAMEKLVLNTSITRSFVNNENISIGAFKGKTTFKQFVVGSTDTQPQATKTFTVNILGEIDSTISWVT